MPAGDVQISDSYGTYGSPQSITKAPNGDLYAIAGQAGAIGNPIAPISVPIFFSNDGGQTWQLSYTITDATERWVGCGVIASDKNGLIHVAFGAYHLEGLYSWRFRIWYFTGAHGAWGAPAIVRSEEAWNTRTGELFSMTIDSLNYPHIMYAENVTNPATINPRHLWYDGSWHFEDITATVFSKYMQGMMVVDPSDNLFACWPLQSLPGEFLRYSVKPSGGSWSAEVSPGFNNLSGQQHVRCGADKDGNFYMFGRTQGRRRKPGDTWDPVESFPASTSEWLSTIACDKKGIWRIIAWHGSTPNLRLFERTVGAVWSQTGLKDSFGPGTGGGGSMLHAVNPPACLHSDGWEGTAASATSNWRYFYDTLFAPQVTTDPATDIMANLATLKGTLDDDGGEACNCGFEWGETVDYGNTTPTQRRTTG